MKQAVGIIAPVLGDRIRRGVARFDVVADEFEGVLHAINGRGERVGHRLTREGTTRAVHVSEAGVRDLGTLGGVSSTARGINDDGIVVGGSLIENDDAYHGFIAVDGVMYDLNAFIDPVSGWEVIHALGINAHGDIVAVANNGSDDRVVRLQHREDRGTSRGREDVALGPRVALTRSRLP